MSFWWNAGLGPPYVVKLCFLFERLAVAAGLLNDWPLFLIYAAVIMVVRLADWGRFLTIFSGPLTVVVKY